MCDSPSRSDVLVDDLLALFTDVLASMNDKNKTATENTKLQSLPKYKQAVALSYKLANVTSFRILSPSWSRYP